MVQASGLRQQKRTLRPQPDPTQMHLGEVLPEPSALPDVRQSVPGHIRREPQSDAANTAEVLPFFDESRVPVETITVIDAAMKQLDADQFEVIGEKDFQRPLSQLRSSLRDPAPHGCAQVGKRKAS